MNRSLVVTGTFGKAPEIRPATDPCFVPRYDCISEVCEPAVRRKLRRDAIVLPLFTQVGGKLERHLLVVLSADQRRLRFPRPGDRLEVEGRPELLRVRDRKRVWREVPHFVVERWRVIERGTDLLRPVVLIGYLGNDPEVRLTRERSFSVTRYNDLIEMEETYEGQTRAREFMVLSLYTHDDRQTRRHRLVVWSSDQLCHRNIRAMRQGDLVKVKGRPELYKWKDGEGQPHELPQVVVERMRVLKRKHLSPQVP
ncbi:MAG TPA: single-stranded DNA-binding protein [Thermoanaerobaculia bacterium]|nr:single-stranded DNA-binding protein [Thermoanaerobaculia bacterium]